MLGSGLGTAAGLISSGAITRAINTQQAKKDLKSECTAQGGTLKNGECVSSTTGERISNTNTPTETTEKPKPTQDPQKAITAKIAEINKASAGTNMTGTRISFTYEEQKNQEINKAIQNWVELCNKFTKPESGILAATVNKDADSNGTLTWKCEATECDSAMSLELKNGECKIKSFSNDDINKIIFGANNFGKKK